MRVLFLSVTLLAAASTASAQWWDNFDAYASGTVLDGVGGWAGWDNVAAAAGTVSAAQANSSPNSIAISGATDAVHPFVPAYGAGSWVITAWQYIPSATFTADTYFIVNNVYNHGGPYNWAIELQFDKALNRVLDDFRAEPVVPILFDAWVEIRVEVDLAANTQTTWYGCTQVSTGTWTAGGGGGGPVAIANIDLFTTGGTCYYDDVSVLPNVAVLPATWTLVIDQPLGTAMLRCLNFGGTAGNLYLNAMTQVAGSYPFGWFFGVAIPIMDLVAEINFGPPFFGTLDACGEATNIVPGPIPSGITAYIVAVEFTPGGSFVQAAPPFVYVTP